MRVASASTWISTWRGRSMNFSMYTPASPKAFSASEAAVARAPSSSSAAWTTRMPFPPPPAAAFTMTGYPISSASARAGANSVSGASAPGTTGTPAARIRRRASVLSPIARMAVDGGPMKTSPACFHRLGEGGAFGEESVAGMDRLRTRFAGHLEQPIDAEVALRRRGRTDLDGQVGGAHVRAQAIRRRIDGDRLEALLVAGADDAQRDFAAVRDEHSGDWCHWRRDGGDGGALRRRPSGGRRRSVCLRGAPADRHRGAD